MTFKSFRERYGYNDGKCWRLWRVDRFHIRSLCGDFTTQAEATRAITQIRKAWPNSSFDLEFTGAFLDMEGQPLSRDR